MIIRVESGKVADIYNGLSDDTIEQLKQAFVDSEFIETMEAVNRGDTWPVVVSELPQPPQSQPKTKEMVAMELNGLVEAKKREYLQRWPSTSQVDLWPIFSEEITRLNNTQGTVSATHYPALAGALSVKLGVEPATLTSEQILRFATAILGAKSAHAIELAKLEECYQSTLTAWIDNPKIDVAAEFEVVYGA